MITFLKNIFKKSSRFNSDGLIISVAFTVGGREYLQADSIYNLPYQRGMGAVKIYEEMKMKCDYEYLKAYATAVNNLLTGNQIKLPEIVQLKRLNDHLNERLNIAVDPDLVYKLASVVYFDRTESPFEYDAEYAKKKIAFWKKHMSVEDFFLQRPLQMLIPYLKSPEITTRTYLEAIQEVNKIHWDEVLQLLSPTQKEHYSDNKESFAGETRQKFSSFTG